VLRQVSNDDTLSHQVWMEHQKVQLDMCWAEDTTTFAPTSIRAQSIFPAAAVAAVTSIYRLQLIRYSARIEVALWASPAPIQKVLSLACFTH
jgi:hypothetical protein